MLGPCFETHVIALALALAGCSAGPITPVATGPLALYDTSPTRPDFYAMPWPADTRLTGGGKRLDLTGFNNPGGAIGDYINVIGADPLGGFGCASAIYFRFDAPIDPATLPQTDADSVAAAASVFVVDVTAGPTYGERAPVKIDFAHDAGNYIETDHMTIRPVLGFPLREQSHYVAVVTTAVHGLDGNPVRKDPRFDLVLDGLPITPPDGETVAVATSFTTGDFTSAMWRMRAAVLATPAPVATDFTWIAAGPQNLYDEYHGNYIAPNFQQGAPPYTTMGGNIVFAADGTPQIDREETLRFAVTVPKATMPAAGWPVVLYAHGTGGDFTSFIDDGTAGRFARIADANNAVIAQLAVISIDQVLAGPRSPPGTDPDLAFVNLTNITAARDNIRQGGTDDFQLLRLVQGFSVAAAPTTGVPIQFDTTKIYFFGHSEGSLTGGSYVAVEPNIKGAVFSGAAAGIVPALLGKTEPTNIPETVAAVVGEPVDADHPLLNLLQNFLEPVDPGNFARFYFRAPATGDSPKSIFQSIGIVDHYAPVPGAKGLALAVGLFPSGSMADAFDTGDLALAGVQVEPPPIMNNVAAGAATGVVCEYVVPLDSTGMQLYDGHFVDFDNLTAERQSISFLGTFAATGTATLVP